jgi:PKD repeat protein
MLDHLTITVPGVPDELRTPGVFVHIYDPWQNGAPAPVAPGGNPAYADFTATPLTGNAPLAVQFTDLSTTPRGAWAWNFGDGGTSTAQNPTYTYAAAGTYTVTLTATGPDGADSKTRIDYITVTAAMAAATPIYVVGSPGSDANSIMHTLDGITWEGLTSITPAAWVHYPNNSSLVITPDGSTMVLGLENSDQVLVSSDAGATWSSKVLPASLGLDWFLSGAHDGTRFILSGTYGLMVTSVDGGQTWTDISPDWDALTGGVRWWIGIESMAWHGGRFIFASDYGLWTSTDNGATLSLVPSTDVIWWKGVQYVGGKLVAVGEANPGHGLVSAVSTDSGATWTLSSVFPDVIYGANYVAWANGIFLTCPHHPSAPGKFATSSDGLTWTAFTPVGFGAYIVNLNHMFAINDLFVAIGSNIDGSSHRVATSPDGVTWTMRATPFDAPGIWPHTSGRAA